MYIPHPGFIGVTAASVHSTVDHVEVGTEHRASTTTNITIWNCIAREEGGGGGGGREGGRRMGIHRCSVAIGHVLLQKCALYTNTEMYDI